MAATLNVIQNADARVNFTTRDGNGTLTNATAITTTIKAPDGTTSTLTLAGGGIVFVATGSYYFVIHCTQSGAYNWHTDATVSTFVGSDQGVVTVTGNNTV